MSVVAVLGIACFSSPVLAGSRSHLRPSSLSPFVTDESPENAILPIGPVRLPTPILESPLESWAWTGPAGFRVFAHDVAGQDTVAVLADESGDVIAVGLRDGTETWRQSIPSDPEFSYYGPDVLVVGDTAVVASALTTTNPDSGWGVDLSLVGLDLATGVQRWAQRLWDAAPQRLLRGPDDIVIVEAAYADASQAAAVDARTGEILWDKSVTPVTASVAAIRADLVVMSGGYDDTTIAVDIETGETIYTVPGWSGLLAEPILYTVTGDFECESGCTLQAASASDGSFLWQSADDPYPSLGTYGEAIVAVDGDDPAVVALGSDGTELWRAPTCDDYSDPIVVIDIGLLTECGATTTLLDIESGQQVQQIFGAVEGLAADHVVYDVYGSDVIATTVGVGGRQLWRAQPPIEFQPGPPYEFTLSSGVFPDWIVVSDGRIVLAGGVGQEPALVGFVGTDAPTS